MTGLEIVKKAEEFKDFVYWYGGKGQLASVSLANALRAQNPSVWTDSYYKKAMNDCDGTTRVADCSHLVCKAYGISDIGSSQIEERYSEWNGNPLPGMIGWKPGHVGIYGNDLKIIEMRGINYDFCNSRTAAQCGFTKTLYDENVVYAITDEMKVGWHKDENGWWYRHTVGTGPSTYFHDCMQTINERRYIFDTEGYICYPFRVKPTDSAGFIYE